MIQKLEFGSEEARFDGNTTPHDHIRCVKCGRVDDIAPQQLDLSGGAKDDFHGYSVLGRRVELWGGLATAWSAYDGRTANGSFHERGINSFQLVKVDGKWLVASVLWQEATPETPLPADLLRKKGSSGK